MGFRYVYLSCGHFFGAYGSHDKKCTVGRRSEEVLHGPDTSDGVDITEVGRVHHVSCYEPVHAIR